MRCKPPIARALLGAALVLLWPVGAHADEPEGGERPFNQLRALAGVSTFSGERLAGIGSIGRYRLGGGGIELDVQRVFEVVGFMAHIGGFAGPDTDEINYVRGEGGLALGIASWNGPVPGGVLIGLGLGGDLGRYWFAEDGRFYGMARGQVRIWPSRDVPLQLTYTALPLAHTAVGGHLQEHRVELASGWSLLTFGSRLGFTYVNAGEPRRTFSQMEIGAFVGLGFFE
jgi:hypothetical protein